MSATTGFSRVPTPSIAIRTTVAGHQPPRRIEGSSDPGGRAGEDDVTRFEGEAGGEVGDLLGDREDHLRGRGVLAQLVVDPGPIARSCGSSISSGVTIQGPIGPWVSKDFPIVKVGRAPLPVPHTDVVHDGEAGDDIEGAVDRHVAAAPADDESELSFVVDHVRDPGTRSAAPGPITQVRCLLNQNWYSGCVATELGHVVGVVHPDPEHLGRVRDGGEEVHPRELEPWRVGHGVRGALDGTRAASSSIMSPGRPTPGAVRSTISSPTTTPVRTSPARLIVALAPAPTLCAGLLNAKLASRTA